VSYASELGYRSQLESWQSSATYPVTFVPTVSRATDPSNAAWTGRTGRVEMILAPVLDELGLSAAELDRLHLRQPGHDPVGGRDAPRPRLPEDQVHKELYWPKGKEPRGAAATDLATAIEAAEANADQ